MYRSVQDNHTEPIKIGALERHNLSDVFYELTEGSKGCQLYLV